MLIEWTKAAKGGTPQWSNGRTYFPRASQSAWSKAIALRAGRSRVPGKLVLLSGILSRSSKGKIVRRGDSRAQIRQVFSNITTALAAAGATWADVVMRQTFTTDIDAYFENIDARAPINLNEVIQDVMTITARPIDSNNIVLNANLTDNPPPPVKPNPHHLGHAARIVAVSLVKLRLQRCSHVPRLDTDYRQAHFGKRAEQPLRQRSSFQSNALEVVGGVLQHRQQRCRFARNLHFTNDLARVIHNTDRSP